MGDTIARLARLRTAEADAARRDLAAAMHAAETAAAAVASAQAALDHEASHAQAEALSGAYAAWLPIGRAAVARARAEEATRAVAVAAARVTLAAARMALRACETLAEAQDAERRTAGIKAEQAMLEDVTRKG